jgi:peptide/nickel transport system permease protein
LKGNPLLKALAKRVGSSLIIMFGVSILIFGIARVIPGDPARISLGPNATQQQVDMLRHDRHLDQPIVAQYFYWLGDLLHGNLGTSLYTHRPVTQDIGQFLPASLELVLTAGILMILIGIPLGLVTARFRGKLPDHLGRLFAVLAVCTPAFVWGVILQLLLGYFTPLFPLEGRLDANSIAPAPHSGFYTIDALIAGNAPLFTDAIYHLALPALALALAGIGQTARLTRSSMIETYRQPYIEMARAYGFSERRIATRWAFRPSLIPTLTVLGLDFAALLANAFLVERVFVWPGLSSYGVDVILHKDLDAIVGTVLIIAAMFLVANLIVDVLVSIINPRIRLAEKRATA